MDDWTARWKQDGPIIRKKGDQWLRDCDITGNSTGTSVNPKFSLLRWWKDIAVPAIEKTLRESFLGFRARISGYDNAGPHVSSPLLSWLQTACARRAWFFDPQPPKTPVWNINDRALFPAISKRMDHSNLRWANGSNRILKRDEIWKVAKHVWDDYPLGTLARSFAMQPYVVDEILKANGSNNWMREPGGLHFDIRKKYVSFDNGTLVPRKI